MHTLAQIINQTPPLLGQRNGPVTKSCSVLVQSRLDPCPKEQHMDILPRPYDSFSGKNTTWHALLDNDLKTYNNVPFFLNSGLPFFTVAITMSPLPAAGSLLRRPLMPCTDIMYRFFAPVSHSASTLISNYKVILKPQKTHFFQF